MFLRSRRRRAALAVPVLLVLPACSGDDSSSGSRVELVERSTRGVALTPESFDREGFASFFARAEEAGSFLAHYGDWADLDEESNAFELVVVEGRDHGLEPVIAVSPFDQGTGELLRPLDDETVQTYRSSAVEFVTEHRPPYFGIGVEGNLLATKNPEAFEQFVELFDAIAPEIREASPTTRVFTTFELEWLEGYRGGAFGGRNDPSNEQWELLDRFPEADLFAFSTYPSLPFAALSDVPADLYTAIVDHTDKPVAFSESGWAVDSVAPGWQSNEAEQARFAERLLDEAEELEAPFAVWTLVYPAGGELFDSMSLRTAEDRPRPVWDVWTRGSPTAAE